MRWALENKLQLTVVSGSHSDHCIRSNVVAIDMANFNETNIVRENRIDQNPQQLVVAGCGCKAEDIIRKSAANGLTIPLGSRPSTGSGLWLQGGIGHLTRQHGLTCDAIVGAVIVTVDTGQILYAGAVPTQYQPPHAERATNEDEILWGLRGAGTSFGIAVHVALVDENDDVDVLIITGMRDEAPVATLSHLVPQKKVVEVHVTASRDARQSRKRCDSAGCGETSAEAHEAGEVTLLGSTTLGYEPDFIFANTMAGESRVSGFAKKHLLPLVSGELSLLADMIRTVPNFPLPGIEFRHVLNIPQLPRGLAISTSLLRN